MRCCDLACGSRGEGNRQYDWQGWRGGRRGCKQRSTWRATPPWHASIKHVVDAGDRRVHRFSWSCRQLRPAAGAGGALQYPASDEHITLQPTHTQLLLRSCRQLRQRPAPAAPSGRASRAAAASATRLRCTRPPVLIIEQAENLDPGVFGDLVTALNEVRATRL